MKTCSGPCKQQIKSHVGKECGICMKIRCQGYMICSGPCGTVVSPSTKPNSCANCKRHIYMETHTHCKKCNTFGIEVATGITFCDECSVCSRCKKDISETTSRVICDDCKTYSFNCITCEQENKVDYLNYIKNPSDYVVCDNAYCKEEKEKDIINEEIVEKYGEFDDNYYIKVIIKCIECYHNGYCSCPGEYYSSSKSKIIKYFRAPKGVISSYEDLCQFMTHFIEKTPECHGLYTRIKKIKLINIDDIDDDIDVNLEDFYCNFDLETTYHSFEFF
jgi:hypothetical protein